MTCNTIRNSNCRLLNCPMKSESRQLQNNSASNPKEFCAEIAYRNMNTDYTATRMPGYLYRVSDPRIEDLVDEMLVILSDRDAIIQKKEMEHAQAVINEIYRNGL